MVSKWWLNFHFWATHPFNFQLFQSLRENDVCSIRHSSSWPSLNNVILFDQIFHRCPHLCSITSKCRWLHVHIYMCVCVCSRVTVSVSRYSAFSSCLDIQFFFAFQAILLSVWNFQQPLPLTHLFRLILIWLAESDWCFLCWVLRAWLSGWAFVRKAIIRRTSQKWSVKLSQLPFCLLFLSSYVAKAKERQISHPIQQLGQS